MRLFLTITALILLALLISYTFYNLMFKGREKRIYYIKNFKKGCFILIYVIAVIVIFAGVESLNLLGFMSCIQYAVEMIVLKLDLSPVQAYAESNILYKLTLFITYGYAVFSFGLLSLSIIGQSIFNSKDCKIKLLSKDITFVFGYSEESINMALSHQTNTILVDNLDREVEEKLFLNNISYINIRQSGLKKILNIINKQSNKINKKITLIINGDFDNKFKILTKLVDLVKSIEYKYNNVDEFQNGLNIYIITKENEISALKPVINNTKGRIRLVDKYNLIAMDFVSKYPITKYMDQTYIDYNTGAVFADKKINMIYIGFGNTNKKLFLSEFANNALYTFDEKTLVPKKINYIFYDKNNPKENLDLNHDIFRFFLEDHHYTVPRPVLPFEYNDKMFKTLDINDNTFYDELLNNIKNAYTFIHICIGDDISNINLANKISRKLKEQNCTDNKIFVRVRSNELARKLNDNLLNAYGMDDVVYNVSNITNERYYGMALDRHIFYSAEYQKQIDENIDVTIQNVEKEALDKWMLEYGYTRSTSNVYACLNLRVKLNLIGYDLVDASDDRKAISFDEFVSVYAKNDAIKYKEYAVSGKKVVDYSGEYLDSLRNNLARQEHIRWNYFMIMSGFIPAIDAEIKKDFERRIHWNITTYEGLKEQEKISRIIQYDYQIMDDAYWLINRHHMKIIKKQ